MHYSDLIRPAASTLPVYQPGKPVELLCREFGMAPESVVKLASNENPLGPPACAREAIREAAGQTEFYPDNSAYALVEAICERFGWSRDMISLGAGSNEIFYMLCDIFGGPGVEVVVGEYAFVSYRIAAMLSGAKVVSCPMPNLQHDLDAMRRAVTDQTRLVFLPNPNNPTGTIVPVEAVADFARSLPGHVVFCYDEAYTEYEDAALDVKGLIEEGVKIISTRTFSKIYALAGLRIGYAVSDPQLADFINQVRPPFNTSSIAQQAALAALRDEEFVQKSRVVNENGRRQLFDGLNRLGFQPFGQHGNFILLETDSAASLSQKLMEQGVIVRPLAGYGLPKHLRISIGLEEQNSRFLEAVASSCR
jgi:histidinol-phosphate aminotransferase